jgi:hypothetical protein
MSNSRRSFLRNLGLGIAGSAGLLIPAQATACHPRRRVVGYCPPPIPEPTFPKTIQDITPCYPDYPGTDMQPTVVKVASNYFCSWGVMATGISITGCVLTSDAAGNNPISGVTTTAHDSPPALTWYYYHTGITPGQVFYLQLSYTKNSTPADPFMWGAFIAGQP